MNDPSPVADGAVRNATPEGPADRLWRLWQAGPPPDVGDFLAREGDLPAAEVAAVLRVDQRQRWLAGERVPAECYLRKFPAVRADPEAAFDLVYGEFLLREKGDAAPGLAEFLWRFPEYAAELRPQVELHRALASGPADVPDAPRAAPSRGVRAWPAIPGYEVLGELGRGGMGVVYKARQAELRRLVALKVLLDAGHVGPDRRARFRAGAEAEARLHHANIVQIYEVGEWDGRPYQALEFVDGDSLRERIAGRAHPPREAAELVETLALAVHHAHGHGVVHRDLKPANILLARDGTPKISDFGLAKRLDDEFAIDPTRSGDILGTPSYMAPEQAAGRLREVGPATDVYALGVILYELVAGRPPFQGETPLETLRQVAGDEPLTPSRLRRGLPRDLETITLECLQKEPRRRYASALALADDLRRFLEGRAIRARPAAPGERLWRWGRRNPKLAGLVALAALLLVVIAVGSSVAAWRLRLSANAIREISNERLWQAKLAEARAHRLSDRAGRRFLALDALVEAGRVRPGPELRDEAIASLALFDIRPAKSWRRAGTPNNNYTFSGNLEWCAYSETETGVISVRRVEDNHERFRIPDRGWQQLRLSEDGRFLAAFRDRYTFDMWNLTGEAPALVLTDESKFEDGPIDFSPDGRQLVVGGRDDNLRLYDLESGRLIREFPVDKETGRVAFHPKERWAAISHHGGVKVRDLDSGEVLAELEQDSPPRWLAWHPGGAQLAVVHGLDVRLWDLASRRQVGLLTGATSGGPRIWFSRTGDLLFGYAWDGMLRVWDPRAEKQLFQTPAMLVGFPRVSPDDRLLAADLQDGAVRLLELGRSPVHRSHSHDLDDDAARWYRYPVIAPTGRGAGRLLASGTAEGISLRDLTTGEEIGLLPAGATESLAFDSAGGLWTTGSSGLYRWPVTDDPESSAGLCIGPPEGPFATGELCQVACSRDGRVVAAACFDGAIVLHRDRPGQVVKLKPHDDVRHIAVDPMGRWVATGSHWGATVKVWDARDGRPSRQQPLPGLTAAFSPDGRWLATCYAPTGHRLWRTGSWEAGPVLGEPLPAPTPFYSAFAPDSKTLAVVGGEGLIRLVDVETGHEKARLQAPDRGPDIEIAFCPTGTRLVAVTESRRQVRVWDLRAIDRELRAVGVDWELRLPEPTDAGPTRPLRVTVVPDEAG